MRKRNMTYYLYKVKYLDGITEYRNEGIVCGHSYADAMSALSEHFGERDLMQVKLNGIGEWDDGILELNQEAMIALVRQELLPPSNAEKTEKP